MRWMALLALCTPLLASGQSRGEYDPIPLISPPWPQAPQKPRLPAPPLVPPLLLPPLDTDRPLAPRRPPPQAGRGISAPMTMAWAFRLTVVIAPPLPVISGTFDEAALFDRSLGSAIDVVLPLERRIYPHVEQVEVH